MEFISKYKLVFIVFIVHGWLWYTVLTAKARFEAAVSHLGKGELVAWGEGVMYGELLMIALGISFSLLTFVIAMVNKERRFYYLIVSFFTALPVVLFLSFSDFLS